MFRSVRVASNLRAKRFHTLPDLGLDKTKGIPGLFSAKGLDIAWFQYHQYVLDNLNSLIKEREVYSGRDYQTPSSVMVAALEDAKQDPVAAKIAHWASLAYSNEFFFQSLSKSNRNPDGLAGQGAPEPVEFHKSDDPFSEYTIKTMEPFSDLADFNTKIREAFDHPLAFRELLVSRGSSIFGNGFVWMIMDPSTKYKVLNCYNSGTPVSSNAKFYDPQNMDFSSNNSIDSVTPLLSINLWQHTYLEDYGVEGKKDFLRNIFDTINWKVVNARAEMK